MSIASHAFSNMSSAKSSASHSESGKYLHLAGNFGKTQASYYSDTEYGDEYSDTEGGFSVFEAALSIIATTISGGIVSIPYAMTSNGIYEGILVQLSIIGCLMFTAHFYVASKDMYDVQSFSELCYISFGKKSIYVINILIAFVIGGFLILYMILFSKIAVSLVPDAIVGAQQDWLEWAFHQREFYVLMVTVLTLKTMLMKSMTQLKIQSRILFIGVVTLLVFLIIKNVQQEGESKVNTRSPEFSYEKWMDSINITLTSYGFIINLFPIAQQMREQNYENVMKAVGIALIFCFSAYLTLSILAQNIYGNNIEINLFDNMKDDSGVLSIGIRILFLIIFLSNIPYLFFPAKMSILNALQEYRFGVFSKVLLRNINEKENLLAKAD